VPQFDGVEIVALYVLDQGQAQAIAALHLRHHHRNHVEAGLLGRPPAALAHHQLITVPGLPDHHRL